MNNVTGLNHLTFAVSDLERSVAFYCEMLGFSIRMRSPASAYLEAGTLWLALVADKNIQPLTSSDYSHAAFSVSSAALSFLIAKLKTAGVVRWHVAESNESFYFCDPDGHKLELHCGDLRRRLSIRATLREPGVAVYD